MTGAAGARYVVKRKRAGAQPFDWLSADMSGKPSGWVPWKRDAGVWTKEEAEAYADAWGGFIACRTNRAEAVARAAKRARVEALIEVQAWAERLEPGKFSRDALRRHLDRLAKETSNG